MSRVVIVIHLFNQAKNLNTKFNGFENYVHAFFMVENPTPLD